MDSEIFYTALKKGQLGEKIIRDFLEKKGWIVYCPFTKNRAHYFDMICTLNKEKAIAIDVKTKARLNKWAAQGINIVHYNQYMAFVEKINIPFWLIFVDDKTGDVHCAELKKLINSFNPNKFIVAWYLKDMKLLFNIGTENIKLLSELDQRNYKFNPVE